MVAITLKQVFAQRIRLLLTVFAVVLGVSFVTGSLVLTDTSQKLFDEQFQTAAAGADLTVRGAAAFDAAMGVDVEREPLPADTIERIQQTEGVKSAVPLAKGQGLLEFDGDAIVPQGPSVLSTWVAEPLGAFPIREGSEPGNAGDVLIDLATATQYGIEVGDTITVRTGSSLDLRVSGLVGFGTADGMPNSTVALSSLETAQELLALDSNVTEVMVTTEDGRSSEVMRALATELGSEYEVASSQDIASAAADSAKGSVEYLQVMLLALAAASLLIGAFLIANTFSIVITQRTRELAVLRAAGATSRQIQRSVLGEALVVGLIASAIGIGLGIAAATGLREIVGLFGVPLPTGDIVVSSRTLLIALAVGVIVTLVSALAPAARASTVSPIAAMRENTAGGPSIGRARKVIGLALSATALAATVGGLAGGTVPLVALGALATVIGLALLAPAIMPGLTRGVGSPLRALGVSGQLAQESAARAPRRTASTVMALALGLTLVMFITIVATSVKGSIRDTYQEVISADFMIESARAEMLGGLPPEVHHHLSELDEVAVASRMQYGHWKDGEVTRALTAIDPESIGEVAVVDMVEGTLGALQGGGIVLAEHLATDLELEVGDTLPMTFSRTGEQQVEIVGLVDDNDAQALVTDYLISLDTYSQLYSERMDASLFVRIAADVSATKARAAIEDALAEFPTVTISDQAAAADSRTRTVDQILGLVTVLLMLALAIALLGITNTLALSVIERTREIGLLRAVGMARSQLGRMIQGEAVLVSVLAVVLGTGLGTAFGVSTVLALSASAPISLEIPADRLILLAAVTAVAGLLAGLLPARRAGNLDVLRAIAQD